MVRTDRNNGTDTNGSFFPFTSRGNDTMPKVLRHDTCPKGKNPQVRTLYVHLRMSNGNGGKKKRTYLPVGEVCPDCGLMHLRDEHQGGLKIDGIRTAN